MMRIAAFACLLVAASAVSTTHRLSSDHQLAKIASGSSLGKTLLLEMQTKIDAGLPIKELENVIQAVNDRINNAQAADDKQESQRQENCTIDKNNYAAAIEQAKKDIARTKNEINTAEAEYDALVARTKTLEAEIADLDVQVEDLMKQIEAGRAQRKSQHEQFVNRSTDTTSVIAALEEIKGVETGSTLRELFPDADDAHVANISASTSRINTAGEHQVGDIAAEDAHDDATDARITAVHESTDNARVNNERKGEWADVTNTLFVQLNTLADKVTDHRTKVFLQVAAKAATALSGSEYENLLRLLDELLEELREYTDDLIRTEKQRAADWSALEATYTEQLRKLQTSKHSKQTALEETYNKKKDKAQQIFDLRDALDEYQRKLEDNQQMLADRTAECNLFAQAHASRTSERNNELATLSMITKILNERIKSTLRSNSRVNEAVNTQVE